MIKERKLQMEYLAFDFGDGTVCAARYNTKCAEPEVLHITNGEKPELWSTLARSTQSEGGYTVGIKTVQRGYELELNWKSKPSQRDDGWERRRFLTVLFMERVFKLFLIANPDYSANANGGCSYLGGSCKIAIGVPCDWGDDDVDEYRNMAKEAGLGDVQVFKEAQAAVLYARRFMGVGLPDEYIQKGTLLVDIGSSTTDFTYLKGDKASNRGLTLGAKYIEHSFLGDAMRRVGYEYYSEGASLESKRAAIKVRNWNLLEIRGYKEQFFEMVDKARGSMPRQHEEIRTVPLNGTNLQLGDDAEGYITWEWVETCLNDKAKGFPFKLPHLSKKWVGRGLDKKNTWRGHFRTALSCLKSDWEIDCDEVTIVVTGGAAIMQFVKDDIEEVFGRAVRYLTGNPGQKSFSVVNGLAWASYATDIIASKRAAIKSEIRKFIAADSVTKIVKEWVVDQIAKTVVEELVPRLESKMLTSYGSMNTKRKIKDFAQEQVKNILQSPEVQDLLKSKLGETAGQLLKEKNLKGILSSIQKILGRVSIYESLPDLAIEDIPLPNISSDIGNGMGLDSLFSGLSVVIATAILYYSMGVFAFVLAPVVAKIFEPKEDDILPEKTVSKVARKLQSKKEVITSKVAVELAKQSAFAGILSGKVDANAKSGVSDEDVECANDPILYGANKIIKKLMTETFMDSICRILSESLTRVKMHELDALEGLANYRD